MIHQRHQMLQIITEALSVFTCCINQVRDKSLIHVYNRLSLKLLNKFSFIILIGLPCHQYVLNKHTFFAFRV
ncbi:hypothetical protein DEJ73_07195 [Chromohalobacter salexigens]|nr:hypothetical protein [Chromohalobacter salexigens]